MWMHVPIQLFDTSPSISNTISNTFGTIPNTHLAASGDNAALPHEGVALAAHSLLREVDDPVARALRVRHRAAPQKASSNGRRVQTYALVLNLHHGGGGGVHLVMHSRSRMTVGPPRGGAGIKHRLLRHGWLG